ncbi:hypothetical protein K466DRAFT_605078 [Polyporus arcularius HHB13444]|uniref:Uncharacterized protein n=1 Tax=Polyporus arcularius HHB13444 TaxID=1314778 RepID=A0A5C3NU34_9APHY|nr:hypothetical protein K466DRAFT_605078 [Polyporus arcularius HHB13444]
MSLNEKVVFCAEGVHVCRAGSYGGTEAIVKIIECSPPKGKQYGVIVIVPPPPADGRAPDRPYSVDTIPINGNQELTIDQHLCGVVIRDIARKGALVSAPDYEFKIHFRQILAYWSFLQAYSIMKLNTHQVAIGADMVNHFLGTGVPPMIGE